MLEEEVEISRRHLGLVSVRVSGWGKIGQAEHSEQIEQLIKILGTIKVCVFNIPEIYI